MKKIILLLFVCSAFLLKADTHYVNAGMYYYAPATISINTGDTVIWINDGGYHDVNGVSNSITGQSFNNPQTFSSQATSVQGGVIHTQVFNTSGVYRYDCSIGSHAQNGMMGAIFVNSPSSSFVNITFEVNMQNEVTNPQGVFVGGGSLAADGGPTGFPMSDYDGDDIWDITLPVLQGTDFSWKFRNGYCDYWNGCPYWETNFTQLGCGYGAFGDRVINGPSVPTTYSYCFNSCDNVCPGADVNVTFVLDVASFAGNIDSVNLFGSFNTWTSYYTLTNTVGTLFEVTVPLMPNTDHEYKYLINGVEESLSLGASCVISDPTGQYINRLLSLGSSDSTLAEVCYNSCFSCGVGIEGCMDPLASNYFPTATIDDGNCLYDVHFQVDMSTFQGSFSGVYVNGTFNGWCGTCNQLLDDNGNGIYEGYIPLPADTIEFLYTTDGWSGDVESFSGTESCVLSTFDPSANQTFNNRLFVVEPLALNNVGLSCFNSCDPCVIQQVDITFQVDMANEVVSSDGVHIVGSFNSFNPTANPMLDANNDGIYDVTITLDENSSYDYRFVNGVSFSGFEDVSGQVCESNFGNRGVITTASNQTLSPVCFGLCTPCSGTLVDGCTDPVAVNYDPAATNDDGSCIYPISGCTNATASNYDSAATTDDGSCVFPVTFTVDMNCSGISFSTVYVTGPFAGWCGDCFPLSDADGDGVWEATYDFAAGDLEYKYEVDNWAHQEDLIDDMVNGGSCAPVTDYWSFANRLVTVSTATVTDDNYGSCDDCVAPVPGCLDPLADNYDPNATVDDGSCTYAGVLGCTDATASNFDSAATTDDGSCVFPVTFTVDMNCYPDAFTTVYVTGPVFGWCADCFPLSDADGDGVWEGTGDFPAGDLEYKYQLDQWAHQEDLVDDMVNGGTCAPVTDYFSYANRLVTVAGATVTDDNYGSCDDCISNPISGCTDPVADNYDPNANVDDGSCSYTVALGCTDATASNYDPAAGADDGSCLYPVTFTVDMNCSGISFSTVYVTGPFAGWCGDCFPLSDADGDGVWEATYDFPAGDLEYKYEVDNWAHQEDLIDDMVNGGSCAPVTDYWSFANRLVTVAGATVTDDNYGSCDDCVSAVLGCTDPAADNYDASATQDDGSCYFLGCTDATADNYDALANTRRWVLYLLCRI